MTTIVTMEIEEIQNNKGYKIILTNDFNERESVEATPNEQDAFSDAATRYLKLLWKDLNKEEN